MVWNTVAHPIMMHTQPGDVAGGDTLAPYPIKFADPHKMAFFDLIIDMSDTSKPVLVHGDYETIKNKILNHEMVMAAEITAEDGTSNGVYGIKITTNLITTPIACVHKDDKYTILVAGMMVLTPENKIIPPEDAGGV